MQYQFDEKHNLQKTTIPINADENYEINYAYAASSGLLENIVQSDKTEVSFAYDKEGDTYKLSELTDGHC